MWPCLLSGIFMFCLWPKGNGVSGNLFSWGLSNSVLPLNITRCQNKRSRNFKNQSWAHSTLLLLYDLVPITLFKFQLLKDNIGIHQRVSKKIKRTCIKWETHGTQETFVFCYSLLETTYCKCSQWVMFKLGTKDPSGSVKEPVWMGAIVGKKGMGGKMDAAGEHHEWGLWSQHFWCCLFCILKFWM